VKLTICTTICCCERGLKKKRKAFHPPIHTTQRVPLYYFVFQHKAMANYNNTIFIVPVHSIVALDKTTPNLLTALSMDASHAQGSQQQPSEGSSSGQQLTLVDISAKLDQIRNAIVSLENRLKELANETNQRINETNQRLENLEKRMNETNQRLENLENHMNETNQRINETNQRLENLENLMDLRTEHFFQRVEATERRLDLLFEATNFLLGERNKLRFVIRVEF
jgi:DNA repair ATPase RecN